MKIFNKFSKLASLVAILSLISQMFVGVMPAMALAPSLIPAERFQTFGTITGVSLSFTNGHVGIMNGLPLTISASSNPALFAELEAQHPGSGSTAGNRYVGFLINPPVVSGYEWASDSLKETTPGHAVDFGSEDRGDSGTYDNGTELWETVAVKSGDVYTRTFRTPKDYEITWVMQKDGSPHLNVTELFSVEQTLDTTAPVGGELIMTTKLHPAPGIVVDEPDEDGVYQITPDLSITGADVFNSLSAEVTDENLDASNVPVYIDGSEDPSGYMQYDSDGGVWNFVQTVPEVIFNEGEPHDLVATFSDLAGNTTALIARFTTDKTPPEVTLIKHDEIAKTITYSFNEAVQLRGSSYAVVSPADYASKLGIYNLTDYAAHVPGTPAPATNGSNLTSAVLSPDGKTITITYTGSLIKNINTTYIVDAWGYNITDLAGNKMLADASTQSFMVVGDMTAPVLTMLGSSPVQITVGTAYTDAGATATDTVDGNLTSQIVKTGTVDTSKVGSYKVTYMVTDSFGTTVSTARTVNVVAAEAPAATSTTAGGTSSTGASSTPTDTTTVASTDTTPSEIKGASTSKDNSDTKSDPGFFMSTWLGIYNWIWLLGAAAAIGGGAWWLFGTRRQD